jgi:hypothetical protein
MSWRIGLVGTAGLMCVTTAWAGTETRTQIWQALLDARPAIPQSEARQAALPAPVWAPGYNWEFTHRPGGKPRGTAATDTWAYFHVSHAARQGEPVVFSWGEYLDLAAPLKRKETAKR